MEKIKNLLKPGKSQDDEAMYGTGQSTGTNHPTGTHSAGLTGEGSHLGGATNTSHTTNPTSTSNQQTPGVGNNALGATGGQTTLSGNHLGQGSHLASATHGQSSTLPTHTSGVTTTTTTQTHTGQSHPGRDAGAGAGGVGLAQHEHQGHQSGFGSSTTGAGAGHNQSTGISSGTTSGPYTSNLANRADPRVDSDNSKYVTQPGTGSSGVGNAQIGGSSGHSALTSLTGGSTRHARNTQTAGTTSSSQHMPGEWVDETDASRYTGTGVSGTHPSSDSHLGRDVRALGGAGVVSPGIHSQKDNDRGLGSATGSSNLGQTSHAGANPSYAQGTSTATDQHLGRDAGIIGGAGIGAGALGSGIHSHHEQDRETGLTSSQHTGVQGPHTTYAANQLDPAVNTRATGHEDGIHHSPTHGGGAEEADHHHGGKFSESAAALGRGPGHQSHQQTIRSAGVGDITSTGLAPHTAGPHQKDIANVLDPRVNPHNAARQGAQATSHSTTDSTGPHYGRDAAIGTGAVGAAGLAGSQYQNHQTGSDVGTSNITGTSGLSSGPAPNTAGPHKSDMLNRLDPRVTANPTVAQGNPQADSVLGQSDKSHASTGGYAANSSIPHEKDYNYGRDAALAGGATSAFVAGGHHGHSGTTDPTRVGQHGASAASQDPYSTSSTQRSTVDPATDRSRDQHLGRDAAVAGGVAGVGGAAYGAEKHHEKELAKAQREAEKEDKHDQKQAEKDHRHDVKRAEKHAEKDEKHHEKKHGFLSFLHRDKSKKYSAEEEADFDRQEREHNASQSHTGRNTALGGAAVAGAGGVYAADKHHDADTNKSLPTAPGNHGIGTGAGTQNALAGNTHGTHDPATHGTPLPEKPVGKDIGDKLHGVDRNRGVTGASGFPNQPGFGDGTTGHEHHHSEATTDQHGHPIGYGTTGAGYESQQAGREFPLGHSKHDSGYTDKTSLTHPTSQPYLQHQDTGRDAAAIGGAGLVGEHEYRKHDATTGQHPGLAESQGQSGLSGNQSSGGYESVLDPSPQTGTSTGHQDYRQHDTTSGYQTGRDTSGLASSTQRYDASTVLSDLSGSKTSDPSGRNRLHKAPPAHHPAAQEYSGSDGTGAHVPASGSDRERLVDQGKAHLDRDTGVVNAPPANSSTNY
ncbi:hypothetical protein BKA65DRAFT_295224 [Rhexocercosporidium sp. MPI-PUGE-AT-0058]|nr:hypothetical protein BKA65DRAFT_295224 [Rhexocercosporidium sp. MPI-PUGE-AT-0058]